MTVGKAIYYLLTNANDVTEIVGTRIFPEVAQQDADLPYIVYNVSNNEPSDTKKAPSKLDTADVEVNCFATNYSQVIDMGVAVRAALDRVKGTYSGVNVQSVQYVNEIIDFDEPQRAYNITASYEVRISRTDFEIAQGSPITGVTLGELSDVNVTGVTDNQILSYDEATDSWIPADDAGGLVDSVNGQTGDVSLGLDDLTDVDAGQPEAGQLLSYGQGDWTTIGQDEIEIPIASVTDLQTELDAIPTELDDLSDVKIIGTPTEGEALVYQSGFFQLGQAGATELGDLDDVNTTGAGFGSLLTYNGASWDISAGELPSDAIYFHQRFATESEALRAGATATVELYFTCTAQGNGLAESASSDTPTAGKIIKRKIYYSEEGFADPDTGTWVEFTPAPADDASFATVKAALLEYLKARTGGTVPISLKQTWEEVDDVPAFVGLLNETYGSGAEAAYSTRRLNGNVTECMVIRRASDGTTTTIGFDGSGNIDESAINTFCTGTTCTVYQWLDQSGNGNTATAASTGEEPTIYTGGALVKEDGRVAIEFDGSNDHLDAGAGFNLSTLTMSTVQSAVENVGNTDAYVAISLQDTDNNIGVRQQIKRISPTALRSRFNTTSIDLEVNTIYKKLLFTTLYNGTNGFSYFDGSNEQTATASLPSTTSLPLIIGQTNASAAIYKGNLQEALLFNSSKSTSDRTSIEENIGDYFTQNTPLLDTYTGAAACYSLRLMRTAYTGDAVEVYNGSSYADIGFNVFGELDTVALAAHCGSNDGFVSKWYDQAGSNDATQTTTANMPKIYDGSTGVVTDTQNKPVLSFSGGQQLLTGTMTAASQPVTAISFVDTTNSPAQAGWFYSLGQSQYAAIQDNGSQTRMYAGSSFVSGGGGANTRRLDFSLFDGANSEIYLNSVSRLTGNPGTNGITSFRIGGLNNPNFNGFFGELIAYPSDQSSNRTNIEDNINTFYSIY